MLVAGSSGYGNYRHQADVAHAYQTLVRRGGVDPSRVIVMVYDDVATDPSNPFPGQLFNRPARGPGEDVYAGLRVTYRGADVTAANLLAVLGGNASGVSCSEPGCTPVVLRSGPRDTVFVYFTCVRRGGGWGGGGGLERGGEGGGGRGAVEARQAPAGRGIRRTPLRCTMGR